MLNIIRPLVAAAALAVLSPLASQAAVVSLSFNDQAVEDVDTSAGVLLTNQYESLGILFSGNVRLFNANFLPTGVPPPPDTQIINNALTRAAATAALTSPNPSGFIAGSDFSIILVRPIAIVDFVFDWIGVGAGFPEIRFIGSQKSSVPEQLLYPSTTPVWVSQDDRQISSDLGDLVMIKFSGPTGIAIDNMSLASANSVPVPEPAGYGLVGVALLASGLAGRRRNKA